MKYVIITRRVSSMGGAQLYVLRRSLHLKVSGYEVFIVVSLHESYFPLEKQFKNIPIIQVKEVGTYAALQSKKRQNEILDNLNAIVGGANKCIIESHSLPSVEWGELFAARFGGRHLAYPLSEPIVAKYRFQPGKRIFNEKLKIGEFYGCNSKSLSLIFNSQNVPSNYVNIGYDENELCKESLPRINYDKSKGDFVISTVTRLDKTYVECLVKASAELAVKYNNQKFVVLIAGGCIDKNRELYLKTNYNNEKFGLGNLDIRYLGYINKLGKDIFNLSDVFVGMGTASINAISQGCLTINIDPQFGMKYASGFFGVDTKNFAYSDSEKHYSIFSKLEEAYLLDDTKRKQFRRIGRSLYEEEYETIQCFMNLDKVVESLSVVKKRDSLQVSFFYRVGVRFLNNAKNALRELSVIILNKIKVMMS